MPGLLTNTEKNNSNSNEENTTKPNADIKIIEEVEKEFKIIEKTLPKKIEKSIEEHFSPVKNIDKSVKPYIITEDEYNPVKKDYDPINDAFWNNDQP